mmetsp:Transcript_6280/g.15571  ORF Transcript_6280/g.15571 Transcript_6280/m.15571 type:complete len:83 (+) Transcript_6280:1438-1686(+)
MLGNRSEAKNFQGFASLGWLGRTFSSSLNGTLLPDTDGMRSSTRCWLQHYHSTTRGRNTLSPLYSTLETMRCDAMRYETDEL